MHQGISKPQTNNRLKPFVPPEDALTKSEESQTKKRGQKSRKQNTKLLCPSRSDAAPTKQLKKAKEFSLIGEKMFLHTQ